MKRCLIIFLIGLSGLVTGQSRTTAVDSQNVVCRIPDNWFGKDKAKHFLLSAVITGAVGYYAHYEHNQNRQDSQNMAVGFSLTLGIAKEIHDKRKPAGIFSWKDLIFDGLGIVAGIGVLSRW